MPLAELTALANGSRVSPDGRQPESARQAPEPMPATPEPASGDRAIAGRVDGEVASTEPVSADPAQLHLRVFADVLARSRKPIKDAAYWRERDRQIVARACETPEAMTAYWLEELATEEVAA